MSEKCKMESSKMAGVGSSILVTLLMEAAQNAPALIALIQKLLAMFMTPAPADPADPAVQGKCQAIAAEAGVGADIVNLILQELQTNGAAIITFLVKILALFNQPPTPTPSA